ncbi:MAG TPA: DUF2486 family protein [Paraburkholderia sp.]|jgi:hypothetical protein|nr:DUF2486 family protein [Paraburkholderia sp.]
MSDAQEPRDIYDRSIPVLTDIVVAGDPARARNAPPNSLSLGEPSTGAAAASAFGGAGERDADALVERLRGRCMTWLADEGRSVVEARCRAALQEHSNWLVGQITREVGLALETELAGWVRDAMRDEAASRFKGAPSRGA